jgi:hypothetical protein
MQAGHYQTPDDIHIDLRRMFAFCYTAAGMCEV